MTDFTRSYEVIIDASVHDVFEYCRDPRHLFEGWPELEVTDVVMTPDGVGTTAHIVGRFLKGTMVEQIEREFTEVDVDERIVTRAHAKVRFAGRTTEVANGPEKPITVVEENRFAFPRFPAPFPEEGTEHTGILKSLALVDGHDADGLVVAFEAHEILLPLRAGDRPSVRPDRSGRTFLHHGRPCGYGLCRRLPAAAGLGTGRCRRNHRHSPVGGRGALIPRPWHAPPPHRNEHRILLS